MKRLRLPYYQCRRKQHSAKYRRCGVSRFISRSECPERLDPRGSIRLPPNGGNRRNLVVAARSGEGPLALPIFRPSSSCMAKNVFGKATRARPGTPPEGNLDGGKGNAGGGRFRLADRRSGLTRLVGHAEARTLGRGLSPIRLAAYRCRQPRARRGTREKRALSFVLG